MVFNAIIGFEKYAPSPEISAKMCQILLVSFGRPNTMNPIIRTIFFSHLYRGQSHFDYKKGSTSHRTSELIFMFLEPGEHVE